MPAVGVAAAVTDRWAVAVPAPARQSLQVQAVPEDEEDWDKEIQVCMSLSTVCEHTH